MAKAVLLYCKLGCVVSYAPVRFDVCVCACVCISGIRMQSMCECRIFAQSYVKCVHSQTMAQSMLVSGAPLWASDGSCVWRITCVCACACHPLSLPLFHSCCTQQMHNTTTHGSRSSNAQQKWDGRPFVQACKSSTGSNTIA